MQSGTARGAASDYSLDFKGATPTTYDHSTGGGAWNDGTNTSVVNSLEQQDILCDETVTYLMEIDVDAGAAAGDHQLEIVFALDTEGTNGNRAGHVSVTDVDVNAGSSIENGGGGGLGTFGADDGHIDPPEAADVGDASVTSVVQVYNNAGGSSAGNSDYVNDVPLTTDEIILTVQLDGLDASDAIILAIDALMGCDPSEGTGNLQTNVVSATDITGAPDAVQVGNQTVPFKSFGVDDSAPALSVLKSVVLTIDADS